MASDHDRQGRPLDVCRIGCEMIGSLVSVALSQPYYLALHELVVKICEKLLWSLDEICVVKAICGDSCHRRMGLVEAEYAIWFDSHLLLTHVFGRTYHDLVCISLSRQVGSVDQVNSLERAWEEGYADDYRRVTLIDVWAVIWHGHLGAESIFLEGMNLLGLWVQGFGIVCGSHQVT